jgi:two-component sensor histidine kinase
VGLSGEKDARTGPGTGFGGRLVHLLTQQLGGQIEQKDEGGLVTVIQFKPEGKAA